jgi:hypothetical protein
VHCSFEESVHCISAFHGRHQFPNGIAKVSQCARVHHAPASGHIQEVGYNGDL